MYSFGINILNTLSFTRKFQVILLTLLLPILYASFFIYQENNHKIHLIENKIIGIEAVNNLKPLRVLAAKHRGTAAQWFAGNKEVEYAINNLEVEMVRAIGQAKVGLKDALYTQSNRQLLEELQQRWNTRLLKNIQTLPASKSFKSHSHWIAEVDNLIANIAIQSGLPLDLNLATYQMMNMTVFGIPNLQENLGQLRGIGAGVATNDSLDSRSFVAASTLSSKIQNDMRMIELKFKVLSDLSAHFVPKELKQVTNAVDFFQETTTHKLLDPYGESITGSDYFAVGTKAIQQVSNLDKALNLIYQTTLKNTKNEIVNSMMLSLSTFVILFLIACYLFICLRITIDKNVGITQRMADDLKVGILNQEYHSNSQDELGSTINALKNAYAQLRNAVSKVRSHSTNLSNSSNELLGVSKEINTLGEEQKNRVAIISTAATELAVTAKEVSSHCESAAQKMHESQQQASLSAKHSHLSAEVIRTLAINVRSTGEEIEQLALQAASISTVIDVIKAIAEQTNLLALNAAIEAARAGEQGRGFAVVADEVRTLATRTQISTNEIEKTIASLQQVAQNAVTAMAKSCERANESEEEATKTGQVLSDIENSINQVSSLIEQVATAGVQQADAANEIAQNIVSVDDASTDLLNKSNNMSIIADKVGENSTELDDEMHNFKV
ncbi:MAG: methyl-accepting chemotaxis protein [Oleispira sp.]